MTEPAKDVAAIDVTNLLTRYGFDLSESTLDRLVNTWLDRYPTQWVRLAVIEALYQGRYKAISVEQILNLWQRRGKSLYRFNHEFERVVCGRFPYTQFSTLAPRFTASSRSTLKPSVPRASTPGASAPNASSPTLSNPPVSQPISPEATPGISAPQPVLPRVDLESSTESIAVPEIVAADTVPYPTVPHSNAPDPDGGTVRVTNLDSPAPEAASGSSAPEPPQSSLTNNSPVATFQPGGTLDLEPLMTLNAARSTNQRQPIHHFVPSAQSSDFCAKLRAVAQTVVAASGE